jgi:hypothetical protein
MNRTDRIVGIAIWAGSIWAFLVARGLRTVA